MPRLVRIMNEKKTQKWIEARTAQIKVGGVYFLSVFYDTAGAMVKVLDKSTKKNKCGWNSCVKVEVVEAMKDGEQSTATVRCYQLGTVHTVNATNLYERREQATYRRTA